MNKKHKIAILIFSCNLLLTTCVQAKEFEKQDNVASDKSWSIKFNNILNTETLDKNINITDSKGNVFDTIMNISDDKKVVALIPKKAYIPDEIYTLNVNQGVKSVKSKTLGENSIEKFTVSKYNINAESEKIIKEFRSHHGYTSDELKNIKIRYLGNIHGYYIYYVPLKKSYDDGNDYKTNGYVFPGVSMTRIIGIENGNLYTLGNMIFETSLREDVGEVYNLLLDEFKDLNKIDAN